MLRTRLSAIATIALLLALAAVAAIQLAAADDAADRARDVDNLRQLATAWNNNRGDTNAHPAATGPFFWIALYTGEWVTAPDPDNEGETITTVTYAPAIEATDETLGWLFSPRDSLADIEAARTAIAGANGNALNAVFPGWPAPDGEQPVPGAGWPTCSYAGPAEGVMAGETTPQTIIGATGARAGVGFYADGFAVVYAGLRAEFLQYETLAQSGIEDWAGITADASEPLWTAPKLQQLTNLSGPEESLQTQPTIDQPPPRWPLELTDEQAAEAQAHYDAIYSKPDPFTLNSRDPTFYDEYYALAEHVTPLLTELAAWSDREKIEQVRSAVLSLAGPQYGGFMIQLSFPELTEIADRYLADGGWEQVSPNRVILMVQVVVSVAFQEREREDARAAIDALRGLDVAAVAAAMRADAEERGAPVDERFETRITKGVSDFIDSLEEEYAELWPQTFAFRDPAPEFSLPSIDAAEGDEPVTLESLRGKTVLLYFFNAWARTCQAIIPSEVKPIHDLYGARGDFAIVAIGTAWSGESEADGVVALAESRAAQREFRDEHELEWTHLYDARGDATRAYSTPGVPHFVLIDIDGTILRQGSANELATIRAILSYRYGAGAGSGAGVPPNWDDFDFPE